MIESALYLERRDDGLGQDFFDAVQAAEAAIAEDPSIGRLDEHGMRKRRVGKFAYTLIYREEDDFVVIYAVASFSQRPGYWVERLP